MPSPHFVSPVDAAWLRMDRPTNPMMITALLQMEGRVAFEDVRRGIETRLATRPRFRQRVVSSRIPLAPPRWADDGTFDLDQHVHIAELPPRAGDAALRAFVGRLMSTPLDRSRPLWDAHVIPDAPGGTAIVARVHHAVGDGVALVGVLLGIADEDDEPRPSRAPARVGVTRASARGLAERASRAASEARTLARLLALPADHPSALKGDLGPTKRAAWSRPIDLERVRAIGARTEAKVNDVLIAAVAGATRAYLSAGDERAADQALRALVPVYVRGEDDGAGMGNHFGLVFVDLPEEAPPLERVATAKLRMDQIKSAPDAVVAMKVLGAMGMASPTVERLGVDLFTGKASMLVTNVPGPASRVRLFGGQLGGLMVWAPVSGSVGLGVTLVSYAGTVRMGVSADVHRLGAPEALVAAFEADLEAIARAAGV